MEKGKKTAAVTWLITMKQAERWEFMGITSSFVLHEQLFLTTNWNYKFEENNLRQIQ